MMMTHRIVLKTHPLLTTHVRSGHSILFRSSLQTTKRPEVPNPCPNVPKRGRMTNPNVETPLHRFRMVSHFSPLRS
jgi:hypothetical protein